MRRHPGPGAIRSAKSAGTPAYKRRLRLAAGAAFLLYKSESVTRPTGDVFENAGLMPATRDVQTMVVLAAAKSQQPDGDGIRPRRFAPTGFCSRSASPQCPYARSADHRASSETLRILGPRQMRDVELGRILPPDSRANTYSSGMCELREPSAIDRSPVFGPISGTGSRHLRHWCFTLLG